MKLLIGLVVMLAVVIADGVAYYMSPRLRIYPYAYGGHSSLLVTPTQQQYHTQDELGQYAYGYSEPLSTKQEFRSLDGVTRGTYTYRDAEGKLQTVDYTADADGFHVAATNLPRAATPIRDDFRSNQGSTATATGTAGVGIADTVEVAAARAAHFAAHEEARLRLATAESADSESIAMDAHVQPVELSNTVEDTAQVAAVKALHLQRVEQEKLRNEVLSGSSLVRTTGQYPMALPLAYRSAVIPHASVYGYTHPLNTRLFASGFYY